jgi:hypothetical protein
MASSGTSATDNNERECINDGSWVVVISGGGREVLLF